MYSKKESVYELYKLYIFFIFLEINLLLSIILTNLSFAELVSDMSSNQEVYMTETDSHIRKRALIQIQRALIKSQEIGDEKLALVSQIMEHIENRTRQLEQDLENLGMLLTLFGEYLPST